MHMPASARMAGDLFPYVPRPGQDRFLQMVGSACDDRAHLVVESGTGTGKTVCALCAGLEHCRGRGKKLLYLTRTNSQQRQVMYELRQIAERGKFFGVSLQGRRNMCPLVREDSELSQGNSDELSKVCSERKARVLRGEERACEYYATTVSEDLQPALRFARTELPTAEEFAAFCVDRKLCPYEVSKLHVPAADVVAAPYIMFFDGFIRHALLDWMSCSLADVMLIVDEAHNLPSYARELESADMSSQSLDMAMKEVDEFGDPEISDGISLNDFIMMAQEVLGEALDEYLIDEDGIIPQSFVEEELMFRTRLTSRGIKGLLGQAANFGEMVRDNKRLMGRLPRSYVHRLAAFFVFWQDADEGSYVKLVTGAGRDALEAFCLDASIACRPVLECHASVHMSGTLRPLDEYRELIGLPRDSRLAEVPSPFPPENRLVLFVDDVTTKYEDIERDEEMVRRLGRHVSDLLAGVTRSAIVFYPSYATMKRISGMTASATEGRSVHFEERDQGQEELMETIRRFKARPGGAVLHAVAGGRVSEGLDFPGEEMELAIVAGIPYPKPTAKQRAFQHFCEVRFGHGWEHAVKAPTARRLQQAIGRLIRSETDRGAAVVLDKRAVHFQDTLCASRTDSPVDDVLGFFARGPALAQLKVEATVPRARRGMQL